jgi:hypothetical protein
MKEMKKTKETKKRRKDLDFGFTLGRTHFGFTLGRPRFWFHTWAATFLVSHFGRPHLGFHTPAAHQLFPFVLTDLDPDPNSDFDPSS